MTDSTIKLLKSCLENREYKKYNDILVKEINNIFVKKIQEKDGNFLYSNQVELLEFSKFYLDSYSVMLCQKLYNIQNAEYEPEILSEKLMDIYKKLKY